MIIPDSHDGRLHFSRLLFSNGMGNLTSISPAVASQHSISVNTDMQESTLGCALPSHCRISSVFAKTLLSEQSLTWGFNLADIVHNIPIISSEGALYVIMPYDYPATF